MPRYNVKHYNAESGMLHSEHDIYAADSDTATVEVQKLVDAETGCGVSADGRQVTTMPPRYRVAVTEVE